MSGTRLALAAAASSLALSACQYMPWSKAEAPAASAPESALPVAVTVEEKPVMSESATQTETCDVMDSREWAAWVNKMPGQDMAPQIHVTGKVDVRSGGYTFTWEEGPLDRSAMPALRLKLVPKAPDGMATMAISTEEVKYEAPAIAARYSRVIISCGGTTLAEITEIMDVF